MATVAQVDAKLVELAHIVHDLIHRVPHDDQAARAELVARVDAIRPEPEQAPADPATPPAPVTS